MLVCFLFCIYIFVFISFCVFLIPTFFCSFFCCFYYSFFCLIIFSFVLLSFCILFWLSFSFPFSIFSFWMSFVLSFVSSCSFFFVHNGLFLFSRYHLSFFLIPFLNFLLFSFLCLCCVPFYLHVWNFGTAVFIMHNSKYFSIAVFIHFISVIVFLLPFPLKNKPSPFFPFCSYFFYFDAFHSSIFLHYSLQFRVYKFPLYVMKLLRLLSQSFILCPFVSQAKHVLSSFIPVLLVFSLSFSSVFLSLEPEFVLFLKWFPVLVALFSYTFLLSILRIYWFLLLHFELPFMFHSISLLCFLFLHFDDNNFFAFNLPIFCYYILQFFYIHRIISVISDKYILVCITISYLMFSWATCIAFWWLCCFLLTGNFNFLSLSWLPIFVSSFRLINLRLLFCFSSSALFFFYGFNLFLLLSISAFNLFCSLSSFIHLFNIILMFCDFL